MKVNKETIVLTGDRPTGPLHIGHYVGSLANRVKLQDKYKQYIMIADVQALTDHYEAPEKIRKHVFDVVCDYLAVGIDPQKSTIFIQSAIPAIAELTIYYLNLVTVNRLKRNPTVKTEIQQKGFGESVPAGFLMYPVSQAADITCVKANIVPVGEDQIPVIEQTNEIVRTFNRLYNTEVLVQAEALVPKVARLPGIDGKAKMSKSLNNAIFLSDEPDQIAQKVQKMYTDPNHIRVSDPGSVEGNIVFTYLDIFDEDLAEVNKLKEHYKRGGLGDVVLKKRLTEKLEGFIKPIREKRKEFTANKDYVFNIIKEGTEKTNEVTQRTLVEVKRVMKLNYF